MDTRRLLTREPYARNWSCDPNDIPALLAELRARGWHELPRTVALCKGSYRAGAPLIIVRLCDGQISARGNYKRPVLEELWTLTEPRSAPQNPFCQPDALPDDWRVSAPLDCDDSDIVTGREVRNDTSA